MIKFKIDMDGKKKSVELECSGNIVTLAANATALLSLMYNKLNSCDPDLAEAFKSAMRDGVISGIAFQDLGLE